MPGKILAKVKDALDLNDDGKVNFRDLALAVAYLRTDKANDLQKSLWSLTSGVTEDKKNAAKSALESTVISLGVSIATEVVESVSDEISDVVVDAVSDKVEAVSAKVKKGKK